MNDYNKIIEGYQAAPGKAEVVAASAIAQAEMFGWIFAQLVRNNLTTQDETEIFLKDLRNRAGQGGAQTEIYNLAMNRFFGCLKD
jgi:hypothetical protein